MYDRAAIIIAPPKMMLKYIVSSRIIVERINPKIEDKCKKGATLVSGYDWSNLNHKK